MKAIILAAGKGERLKPLTNDRPKCLVRYRNIPLIEYCIHALRANGIEEISIVAGYKAELLSSYNLKTYFNPLYDTTNMLHSLFCACEEFDSDLIVSYSDIVYGASHIKQLAASTKECSILVDEKWLELWQSRMENPLLDAETLKTGPDGAVTEIGNRPTSLSDIEAQYLGLIKFSKAGIRQVADFYNELSENFSFRGESLKRMQMTTFLQLLIDNGLPVYTERVQGGWLEIDCPSDLKLEPVG